jgi:hypothetical protein
MRLNIAGVDLIVQREKSLTDTQSKKVVIIEVNAGPALTPHLKAGDDIVLSFNIARAWERCLNNIWTKPDRVPIFVILGGSSLERYLVGKNIESDLKNCGKAAFSSYEDEHNIDILMDKRADCFIFTFGPNVHHFVFQYCHAIVCIPGSESDSSKTSFTLLSSIFRPKFFFTHEFNVNKFFLNT